MAAIVSKIQQFLRLEASAGILLMFVAMLALLATNSIFQGVYDHFLGTPVKVQFGDLIIAKPLLLWINDGLMAIFFFLVGLEIKREVLEGELSSFDKASLPIFGAIGGMLIPALTYTMVNFNTPDTMVGWAIPAATDIAFALGILLLIGARAPLSLKILLLAIAIIDDLGAIIIIALFYTSSLSISALLLASLGILALFGLNRMGVRKLAPYVLVAIFMWVCVLKSGVHATMAGVIAALFIPLSRDSDGKSLLHKTEHALHPWVAFLVLPLFAFANAGMSFSGLSISSLTEPLPLGIILGLAIGKPLGVFVFCYGAVKLGLAKLPDDLNWSHIAGLGFLTGVGFTMSLFIGSLAFSDPATINTVRFGVLVGSILSGIIGYSILQAQSRKKPQNITHPTNLTTVSTGGISS